MQSDLPKVTESGSGVPGARTLEDRLWSPNFSPWYQYKAIPGRLHFYVFLKYIKLLLSTICYAVWGWVSPSYFCVQNAEILPSYLVYRCQHQLLCISEIFRFIKLDGMAKHFGFSPNHTNATFHNDATIVSVARFKSICGKYAIFLAVQRWQGLPQEMVFPHCMSTSKSWPTPWQGLKGNRHVHPCAFLWLSGRAGSGTKIWGQEASLGSDPHRLE